MPEKEYHPECPYCEYGEGKLVDKEDEIYKCNICGAIFMDYPYMKRKEKIHAN